MQSSGEVSSCDSCALGQHSEKLEIQKVVSECMSSSAVSAQLRPELSEAVGSRTTTLRALLAAFTPFGLFLLASSTWTLAVVLRC